MSAAEFLQSVDAFSSLGPVSAKQLAEHVEQRKYPKGEKIIQRGDPGDAMFVIQDGWVRVPLLDDAGRQVMIAELGPGQCFGEMALLTGEPRTADVVAGSKCSCVIIPRREFYDLVATHPQVAVCLTELLGERLIAVNGIRKVGKYRLLSTLGRGGVATVYEGVHPTLGRSVAIKMLSHGHVYHPHFADRFRNEARIIAGLRHPNIVEVFDTEEAYATFFIIMEKLDGRDIERILDEGKIFGADEVRNVLCQVAEALDVAHDHGVVHRDVKPSNIFMTPDGNVKLTDFGIALVPDLERELYVNERQALGSPLYMSPEQAMAHKVDRRTDIYALGIVAYEMITGLPPFDHDDPREVLRMHVRKTMPSPRKKNPSVPADIEQFIKKACAKGPEDRFQTAREVLDFFGRKSDVGADLNVKTLTFVYQTGRSKAVDKLIDLVQKRAAKIDGLIVR